MQVRILGKSSGSESAVAEFDCETHEKVFIALAQIYAAMAEVTGMAMDENGAICIPGLTLVWKDGPKTILVLCIVKDNSGKPRTTTGEIAETVSRLGICLRQKGWDVIVA